MTSCIIFSFPLFADCRFVFGFSMQNSGAIGGHGENCYLSGAVFKSQDRSNEGSAMLS